MTKNCGSNRMCKEKKVTRDKRKGSEVQGRQDIFVAVILVEGLVVQLFYLSSTGTKQKRLNLLVLFDLY